MVRHWAVKPDTAATVYHGLPESADVHFANPTGAPPRIAIDITLFAQHEHPLFFSVLQNLQRYDWALNLIGTNDQEDKYNTMIRNFALTERVRFVSEPSDMKSTLAQAQVFLMIGTWNTAPKRILEAMRAGVPVVASACGTSDEFIADGKTGFLVPTGDDAVLAQRLELLITNPNTRLLMGTAGLERFERHFTLDQMIENLLAVYDEATHSNHNS